MEDIKDVSYLDARAQNAVIGGLFRDLLEAARRGRGGVGLTRVALRVGGRGGGDHVGVVVAVVVAAVDVGRLRHHHADAVVQPLQRLRKGRFAQSNGQTLSSFLRIKRKMTSKMQILNFT